jgi:hypothetical protein
VLEAPVDAGVDVVLDVVWGVDDVGAIALPELLQPAKTTAAQNVTIVAGRIPAKVSVKM